MFLVYCVGVCRNKRRGDFRTTYMYTFSQPADDVGIGVVVGVVVGGAILITTLAAIIITVCYIAKHKGKNDDGAGKKDDRAGKKDDDGPTENESIRSDHYEIEMDGALSKQY